MSFLDRYNAGERRDVWAELLHMGDLRDENVRLEATAVCDEIVSRSLSNMKVIRDRLTRMGYRFADATRVIREATDLDRDRLKTVQAEFGSFPLLYRRWYSRIACVDFRQAEEQLNFDAECERAQSRPYFGLGRHPSLLFIPVDEAHRRYLSFREEKLQRLSERGAADAKKYFTEHYGKFLPISGTGSNCETMALHVPSFSVDSPLFDDGAGPEYLRRWLSFVFKHGGFPEHRDPRRPLPGWFAPDSSILPQLAEGLVPI